MISEAVVPVAGLGTRLRPATRALPKPMLPIVDQPVVQYVIGELAGAGIERVLFVTAAGDRTIEDHFDRNGGAGPLAPADSLELLYTPQPEPNGLGGALLEARTFARGDGVVVALGDAIIAPPQPGTPPVVRRLADAFLERGAAAAIAVTEVEPGEVSRYGIVVADAAGEVTAMVEKPAPGTVPSRLAVAARYVLGPSVFAALRDVPPDAGGEIQLTDAVRRVIADGERVIAVRLGPGERRHDVGTVEGYCAAFVEHALRHPALGASLRARAAAWLDG